MINLKKLASRKAGPEKHNIEDVRVNEDGSGQKPKWPKTKRLMKVIATNAAIYWFKRGLFWLWENREEALAFLEGMIS